MLKKKIVVIIYRVTNNSNYILFIKEKQLEAGMKPQRDHWSGLTQKKLYRCVMEH